MSNQAMAPDQWQEHFWSKVNKEGPVIRPDLGPCWVWTDYCKTNGYGQCYINRRPRYAHRLSYGLANGPFDWRLKVLHRCDNPPCVRPEHLFLGTSRQNTQDAVSKGRMPRGERAWVSKLSDDQIAAIRSLVPDLQSVPKSEREVLARALGITMNHLTAIVVHRARKAG